MEHKHVVCLSGCRIVNKRMAMFIEGVLQTGLSVRVIALPRGNWILDKSEEPTVTSRLGKYSADIGDVGDSKIASVMCFHWCMLPFAVLMGLIRRVPVLYDEHDHYELNTLEGNGSRIKLRFMSLMVRLIHRVCLPWVTLVTCIHLDQQTLKRHLERWQPAVLEINNYPASVWRESRILHPVESPLCFVYIGGVYWEKGVGVSAEAFQLLPMDIRRNAEFHVFGEGDAALIDQLRTMPGVVVHNGVTPAEFRRFTSQNRCCGLALLAATPRYSLVGTNCTKLFEYLALGMPVIATRVGEFPMIVGGNQVGLLIDGSLNAEQLATAMKRLTSDAEAYKTMTRNALEMMNRPEMTWEFEWNKIEQSGIVNAKSRAA